MQLVLVLCNFNFYPQEVLNFQNCHACFISMFCIFWFFGSGNRKGEILLINSLQNYIQIRLSCKLASRFDIQFWPLNWCFPYDMPWLLDCYSFPYLYRTDALFLAMCLLNLLCVSLIMDGEWWYFSCYLLEVFLCSYLMGWMPRW